MIFDLSSARRVTLADADLFHRFQERYPSISCERSFANLMLYFDSYDWHFVQAGERLLTVSVKSGHVQFPSGEWIPAAELAELLAAGAQKYQWKEEFYDVPDHLAAAQQEELAQCFRQESDPDEYDYLYHVDALLDMKGEKLRKKHNLIRQFERNYPKYQVREITRENLGAIIELAYALNEVNDYTPELGEENLALERLNEYFDRPELGLLGIALYADSETLVGFSLGSQLTADCADVHFEKARREFKGAGAMVTFAMAQHLQKWNIQIMNREQDLGDEGLRHAKRSLDPWKQFERSAISIR